MDFFINATAEGSIATPREVLKALHDDSETLALMLRQNVRDRTPVDTGALSESVSSHNSRGNVGATRLVDVYFDDEPQLFEWGRVYVAYQEGPPLGLPTYTNAPRQMLSRSDPEDIPYIEGWAKSVLDELEARLTAEKFASSLETWLDAVLLGAEE